MWFWMGRLMFVKAFEILKYSPSHPVNYIWPMRDISKCAKSAMLKRQLKETKEIGGAQK